MPKQITLIEGHPDTANHRFGRALADAYAIGAEAAGHRVRRIAVGTLDFSILRSREDWENGAPPAAIREAQEAIAWADHLVIAFPLWLGTMPALLKAFFEQVFRPGFATARSGRTWKKLLKGRSAHIVVTMGMPAFLYRWYFGAHGLKTLERGILAFVGIAPVRSSLIGGVESDNDSHRLQWLAKMHELGGQGR